MGEITKKEWIKAGIYLALYILFLIWVRSWMGIILIPFIFDALTTHIIKWKWWKNVKNKSLYQIMDWVDAIVFALVAVYFVNIYLFQNYAIPSSSLEKSLLVGDHLYVSKVAYGPRKPMTPLTMPLTQNQFPGGTKSYFEKPQWPYERIKGFGKIKLNEIVVFNYPSGDTLVSNPKWSSADYYGMIVYPLGKSKCKEIELDSLSTLDQRRVYDFYYKVGRQEVLQNEDVFGKILSRPVDRRENYVKRCVGLPGQTLEIKDGIIWLDGVQNKQPDEVQTNYIVTLQRPIPESLREKLHLTLDDLDAQHNKAGTHIFPLTQEAKELLAGQTGIVSDIRPYIPTVEESEWLFPQNKNTKWTIDNYGPIWIPAKGATLDISLENLPFYERIIKIYEGNDLKVERDGTILINGRKATSYTFKMDYYWMMGDNRQNSADSRFWGFVPEDHIVGRPVFIWLSLDKDKNWGQKGKIRWNRMFRAVKKYN
ncbi:MAG: S26 family signal peptidase [Bacteroidaceae bacterium]|nr:S26 family signal peptidase [Bacteroidaceae bacterium]MBR6856345.1 S26 family signal peptidase [Bacteroidaceae bacterium]